MIHKTAIINKSAQIHPSAEVGEYAIIGENVSIGQGTKVGPYSFIEYSIIGENCKISNHTVIGAPPQDMKYGGQETKAIIGNNCTIREFTTIHRGSSTGVTKVGNGCYFMAYSHIAHDCVLGDEVILANCGSLAGHVEVEDFVIIGGLAAVHQYTRIGKLAMLGGGAMVTKDVPPFTMASGDRARLYGLNVVGLKRRGFKNKTIKQLKHAYHILFNSRINFSIALRQLEETHKKEDFGREVDHIIGFIKMTKRGIVFPANRRVKFNESDT
ncbi:MAG: acyl-ACP--UDP-N-acetylglucosamine O-acyltransferase [Elusimicrobiota bacterium]